MSFVCAEWQKHRTSLEGTQKAAYHSPLQQLCHITEDTRALEHKPSLHHGSTLDKSQNTQPKDVHGDTSPVADRSSLTGSQSTHETGAQGHTTALADRSSLASSAASSLLVRRSTALVADPSVEAAQPDTTQQLLYATEHPDASPQVSDATTSPNSAASTSQQGMSPSHEHPAAVQQAVAVLQSIPQPVRHTGYTGQQPSEADIPGHEASNSSGLPPSSPSQHGGLLHRTLSNLFKSHSDDRSASGRFSRIFHFSDRSNTSASAAQRLGHSHKATAGEQRNSSDSGETTTSCYTHSSAWLSSCWPSKCNRCT